MKGKHRKTTKSPIAGRLPTQTGRREETPRETPAETKPKASSEGRNRQWLFAAGLMVATFIVYLPALHGGFIWDDDTHISKNNALLTLGGLRDIWIKPGATCQYYPLSFTCFWLAYHLWGLNTLGYHVLNVLLHGLASVLLWRVLKALKVPGAWLAGAIFALHPVCVMSVAWMTELKNTLSGGLALGSGWAYIRAAGLGKYERAQQKLDWRYYVLSLVLFQLAIFAKTAVSFLPVTLGLVVWWQRKGWKWREVLPLIPMLGIAVGMGLVTIYVEQGSGGASGEAFRIPLAERVLISGRSFWFYLGKIFFPHNLTFIYERWKVNAGTWWQWLYPLATVGVLGGLWWKRKSLGKGMFAAGMHFYISTSLLILIVVLYMTQFTFVSDHWQYFGCMSVVALAAAGLTRWLEGLKNRQFVEPALYTGLFLVLGILTWQQCGMYKDIETLWRVTLVRNPGSPLALNNLGVELLHQRKLDEAVIQFDKALEEKPGYADAHFNLGTVLLEQGHFDDAVAHFRKSLEIHTNDYEASNALGNALMERERYDEAIGQFMWTLRFKPDDEMANNNLGLALMRAGRYQEAIPQFQRTLQISPDDPLVEFNLAESLAGAGRFDDAIAMAEKAEPLANTKGNTELAAALKQQLGFYRTGRTAPDSPQTNAPATR